MEKLEKATAIATLLLFVYASCTAKPVIPDSINSQSLTCGKGAFVRHLEGTKSYCEICPQNYYMDEDNHTHEWCKTCSDYDAKIDYVKIASPCTRERDSVIERCIDGFYIDRRFSEYECHPCSSCTGTSRDVPECCSLEDTGGVNFNSTLTPPFNPKPTSEHDRSTNPYWHPSPTPEPVSKTTNHTTMSTGYLNCEDISLEECQDAKIKNKKCSIESQTDLVLCKTCTVCQPVAISENPLSTASQIGIAIACLVVIIAIVVLVRAYLYKKQQTKRYHQTSNNDDNPV